MEYYIKVNKIQTPIEELGLDSLPNEVVEQFYDFINNVPYIQSLISEDRPYAKDLPKDDEGKIIIDITKPHILEDMEYFMQTAITFQKTGKYTDLRPNPNPNSEYGKWLREELRRCYDGMVRPSDGEWITGDMYFFLNYCPMLLIEKASKNNKMGFRKSSFPRLWEGHYYLFHYLNQARQNGKHAFQLASRAKGKSFVGASLLTKRFLIGENSEVNKKVISYITASDKKYLWAGDQTLDKFVFNIDHCAINTQFPSRKLVNSPNKLEWISGYKDLDTDTNRGTLNAVIGISSANDESKLRGTRGVLYVIEEMGTFPKLLDLYGNTRHSVEQGDITYGLIFAYGTAGDNESDFSSAQEIMYNPSGYNVYAVSNVYDKEGQSKKEFVYFFPGYMNYEGLYDKNGNSNVTASLLKLLMDRYQVKYNTSDINAITKRIAESPIVPQEAILRTRGNMFPMTQLNERLAQIDNNPDIFNDVYIGTLVQNVKGEVEFKPSTDIPIRDFPTKDNKVKGAIEIFEMPEKDNNGRVFSGRYIIGHDPVDDDTSNTMSLTSTFVLDLFTDKIVAEYTGRQDFADDNFEQVRLLCLFYNAKCLYEQNKKGIFAYFSQRNCLYLLAETPEYLRDKQIIKDIGYGNKSRGVNATAAVNNYANSLIRDWLLKPVVTTIVEDNEEKEVTVPNLHFIRNRALLKELILFNPDINVDRIRALGMVMLYREEKIIQYQGDMSKSKGAYVNPLSNDEFFKTNYDDKYSCKFSEDDTF